jgi:hypothetical protein
MKALYEMVSVKIAKQNARSSARLWSIKEWTLWRGRPPPKLLKSENHNDVSRAGHVGTPATVSEEGKEKSGQQEDCDLSGSASKLTVSCSGRAPLRREWQ